LPLAFCRDISSALVAQAASTLNTMSEEKLKIAVKQLKALQEL